MQHVVVDIERENAEGAALRVGQAGDVVEQPGERERDRVATAIQRMIDIVSPRRLGVSYDAK